MARLGTALELLGAAALTYGVWLLSPPLAVILGGAILVLVAQGVGREP